MHQRQIKQFETDYLTGGDPLKSNTEKAHINKYILMLHNICIVRMRVYLIRAVKTRTVKLLK